MRREKTNGESTLHSRFFTRSRERTHTPHTFAYRFTHVYEENVSVWLALRYLVLELNILLNRCYRITAYMLLFSAFQKRNDKLREEKKLKTTEKKNTRSELEVKYTELMAA